MPPPPSPFGLVKFLNVLQNLKITKRTGEPEVINPILSFESMGFPGASDLLPKGWVNNKVPNPESISDHMHRMSVMAMVVGDESLDRNKCIKMALVHDLGEAIVGDITPHDGVSDTDKHAREQAAFTKFRELLGDTPESLEMMDLWQEYESGSTEEAKLVKDLDKFEMIVQALEYERAHRLPLDQFFTSTRGKFRHPTVKQWAEEVERERGVFWDQVKAGTDGNEQGEEGKR
ncbi:HD domain-containing protein 2 [Gonapodya sp. JEL0774]|nr:HD domain-containing protein 2 [Gonapodya sp. JEL0774]